MLTTLFLSRLQFAITISFHILFPAFSIGLATYLVMIESLWLCRRKIVYYQTARFWSKVLALTFGMGIVSGLAMQFQIGTNWAGFTNMVGPVLGVLFTLEALSAFFIEATFLGVMLFGWHYVPRWLHYLSTLMVCVGVSVSAFWILAANSWMQTPAGVSFVHNIFIVHSWKQVIFNHSTVIRYAHMMLAAYLSTACVIAAVSSYYLLKRKAYKFAQTNLKIAIVIIALVIPMQIVLGDAVGYNVHQYQPIKTAAIEANWQTMRGAPMLLFADIDQSKQRNDFAIGVPYLASLLNTHHMQGQLLGLKVVPLKDQPNVWFVFYSFRIMVALGILLLVSSWYGVYLLMRRQLTHKRRYLMAWLILAPSGFVALLMGWYTAECGRQPWVVYNYIKTSMGVSHIGVERVMLGFFVILVVYGLIFGVAYLRYLLQTIKQGPHIKPRRRLLQRRAS